MSLIRNLPIHCPQAVPDLAPRYVGQAFQPAGFGDFLFAGGLPWGWKAPLTGRLESLPYLVTRIAGWPKALLL